MAAATGGNEVDDTIRELKKISGFNSYLILNNDGIVIKYESMSYRTAVHHAHLVLSLCAKATKYMKDLFEPPDNDVESIRLNTKEYEMIVAQHGNFTIVVTHSNIKQEAKPGEGGEKKDGEPEAKKEG